MLLQFFLFMLHGRGFFLFTKVILNINYFHRAVKWKLFQSLGGNCKYALLPLHLGWPSLNDSCCWTPSQEAHVALEMGKGGSSLIKMSPEYAEVTQLRNKIKASWIHSEDSAVFHSFNDYYLLD